MSSPDKGAGPQITQDVLYQVSGTHVIIAGTIYGINANGTVNLVSFDAAGATNRASVPYSGRIRRSNRPTLSIAGAAMVVAEVNW
jgi:hypothetical protein